MRLLVVMAAALAVACSFTSADDRGRFRCDAPAECPAGTTCLPDGYCGEPVTDPPDAATEVAVCGTTDALRDDFESQVVTASLWSCNDGIEVRGGELYVDAPANAGAFGSCQARRWYLFDDSGVSLRVSGPSGPGSGLEGNLRVDLTDGSSYRVEALNGIMVFDRKVDATSTEIFRVDYDPAEHAWWRFAERDGAVVFFTSRDGELWEERASDGRGLPAAPVYVRPVVEGWADDMREQPGAIKLDDFNRGTTTSRCDITSLVDPFDAGEIAHWWQPVGGAAACSVYQTDAGALAMTTTASFAACGVESRLGYDLGDGEAVVEVAEPGDGGPSLNFELRDPAGRAYRFHLHESPLQISVQIEDGTSGADEVVDILYDPAIHRLWRFRQRPGELYLETSGGEGGDWIELYQVTPGGPLDDVVVRLSAITEAGVPDDTEVGVDDLNRP